MYLTLKEGSFLNKSIILRDNSEEMKWNYNLGKVGIVSCGREVKARQNE